MKKRNFSFIPFSTGILLLCLSSSALADSNLDICPRPPEGSIVTDPPDAIKSQDGFIHLTAHNAGNGPEDEQNIPNYDYRFCLLNNDRQALQSPVLRVAPGQTVNVLLSNRLQYFRGFPSTHLMAAHGTSLCAAQPATLPGDIGLTNLHFHGLNVSPLCGGDEVINTVTVPPSYGGTSDFRYSFTIPVNEPPGLYWYHPHVHGISQEQILGGMTGVLVVSGMENFYPEVAHLKERIFVLRDSDKPNPAEIPGASPDEPWKDVSINYVPVKWNGGKGSSAPKILIGAGERQFWRVANAAADTPFILKLQYRYGNNDAWQDQPLEIIARDGVPITNDDGSSRNGALIVRKVVLPPAARVEFIMAGPPAGVEARLYSADFNDYLLSTNNNPRRSDATDRNPARVLAEIQATAAPRTLAARRPLLPSKYLHRFTGLRKAKNVRERTLFFTKDPGNDGNFFITVEGNVPKPFQMDAEPDIGVNMPAVEEWTVENRDNESHVFHIHQVHFRVVEINGVPTSERTEQTLLDTIELPACRDWGNTDPDNAYANDPTFLGKNCRQPYRVKLRMEFREKDIAGTFLYHCHILEHEDKGMMAKIKLVWNPQAAARNAQILKKHGLAALIDAEKQQAKAKGRVRLAANKASPAAGEETQANSETGLLLRAGLTDLVDRFGNPIDPGICTTSRTLRNLPAPLPAPGPAKLTSVSLISGPAR